MTQARLVLYGERDAPDTQRAALALSPRGATCRRVQGGQSRLELCGDDGLHETAQGGLEMLELIERLHPDQPFHPLDASRRASHRGLMASARGADGYFEKVLAAHDAADLDLALHFLFQSLKGIEAGIEPPPKSSRQPLHNLDVMLAPLLWRITLLDRTERTFIFATLPRLAARSQWILAQIEVVEVLDDKAAARFTARLQQNRPGHSPDATTDWSRALGPAGHEPSTSATVSRQA